MLPVLAAAFRRRKRPVGLSWRMDETYVKISNQWKYLYRAVDRDGDTVDFLLRAKPDHAAARAFFERAMDLHGVPEKLTIDKSGANTAAITSIQADSGLPIEMRQSDVARAWLHALRRRGQHGRMTWARFRQYVARYLPLVRVLHPYPSERFAS